MSDVVIVGGGVAGLQAAARLCAAGLKVTLLEARQYLGGRIRTLRMPGEEPVELGAEFVHGRPPEILSIAEAAGLGLREVTGEPWFSDRGRLAPAGKSFAAIERVLRKMAEPQERDRSFREFIDERFPEETDAKADAIRYVEGFHAASPERISVRGLVQGEAASAEIEGERHYWAAQGYDALVSYLHAQIRDSAEVLLGTVVRELRWRQGRVEVQGELESEALSLVAPRALITLPLAVLQAGSVRFDPELSEKHEPLRRLEMGAALRITFRFRHRFWEELQGGGLRGMSFLFSRDPEVPTWWARPDTCQLTGWAGGPRGTRMAECSEGEFTQRALGALAMILGVERGRVESEVESAHTHNWVTDPYCRGGYSYVAVGGEDAPRKLAAPVADTLFFAGEATEFTGHISTVNGAMASGVRAANEILDRAGRSP